MKKPAQWWHWLLTVGIFAILCTGLWRMQSAPKTPNVTTEIPKGSNADAAMQLNTTGGE